jgi:2'-5' RNA ligase
MSELVRTFIAFDVEEEAVLRRITSVQRLLAETGADLRLVNPKNIHITVRFLGEVRPQMIDRVYQEMMKISFSAFEVELKGLGAFPNLRRARVVWTGIRRGAEELVSIFDQLEPNLRMLGLKPDRRGFSPHLTIARVRTGRARDALARRIRELSDYEFGVVSARCLRLKKSVLTPRGPIYSTLKEVCR